MGLDIQSYSAVTYSRVGAKAKGKAALGGG